MSRLYESHLWHPYTKRSLLREDGVPMLVRGEGPYLFDDEGNRFIDGTASWWCASLGHSHPAIVEAIRFQAATLQHSILGGLGHPQAVELAERLAHLMPTPDRHVHFGCDGASSIEIALKISLQFHYAEGRKEKTKFLSLREAYHGDTLATVGLGFIEDFHKPFAHSVPRVEQLPVPGFDATLEESIHKMETYFTEQGDTLAAFIAETLCQGAGGMRIYPPEFLARAYELCQEHQVVYIADEIATGFHRTGTCFAFEQAGIDPDIVCVGKGLSAGALPISGAITKDKLYDVFQDGEPDMTFYHGHTFAGNPIAAAAANAALKEYETDSFKNSLQQNLTRLNTFMAEWESEKREGISIRHLGLVAAVNFSEESDPDSNLCGILRQKMIDQGMFIRPLGRMSYLMPPLNMPTELLEELLQTWKREILNLLS